MPEGDLESGTALPIPGSFTILLRKEEGSSVCVVPWLGFQPRGRRQQLLPVSHPPCASVTRHISCPQLSLAVWAVTAPQQRLKPFPYRQERAALGSDQNINVAWEFHPVVIEVILHLLPSDQVTQCCHIMDTCKSKNKFPDHWTETNVSPDFGFPSVLKEQSAEGFLQSSCSFLCLRCLPDRDSHFLMSIRTENSWFQA